MLYLSVGQDHTFQVSRTAGCRYSIVIGDVCVEYPDDVGVSVDNPLPLYNVDVEGARLFCHILQALEKVMPADATAAVTEEEREEARRQVEAMEQDARSRDPALAPVVIVGRLATVANYLNAPVILTACIDTIVARGKGKAPKAFVAAYSSSSSSSASSLASPSTPSATPPTSPCKE